MAIVGGALASPRLQNLLMRAHVPFPVLLVTASLVLASVLLPVRLLAKNHKDRAPKQPRAAHHEKAVHPRSNVHKAGKHDKHVSLSRPSRRHAPLQRASKIDDAASIRVHSWVKNHPEPSAHPPTKATNIADHPAGSQQGVSAPPSEPITSDEAKQISSVVDLRSAASTGGDKIQLPSAKQVSPEAAIMPTLYNKRGRLVVPPALKGSHEILIRQNQMADSEGLDRIRDDDDLERMRRAGTLIAIPTNSTLRTDERLPANRRYCRPWTALFLDTLARQHYAHFQTALQVNSAVRTVEFQQRLIHTNGNAAPAEGDTASPHLTGQAVDIAKRGLSMAEIAWLRGYLLPLVQQGKVDVEEEFQQSCFHISVYRRYMPQGPSVHRVIATTHREGISPLATMLR